MRQKANTRFFKLSVAWTLSAVVALASLVIIILFFRSALMQARKQRASLEEPAFKIHAPDICYTALDVTELNPDTRTAQVRATQVFLHIDPEDPDADSPLNIEPLKGEFAERYNTTVSGIRKRNPQLLGDDVDLRFSRIFVFDYFGDWAAVSRNAETAADQPRNWSHTPTEQVSRVVISGEPFLYPFDRYRIDLNVGAYVDLLLANNTLITFPIVTGKVVTRLPEYVVAQESITPDDDPQELFDEAWPRVNITVQRPNSLQLLAVFVSALAFVSAVWISLFSDMKNLFRNSAAYFLTLWALKGILSGGAPKTVNVLDYGFVSLILLFLSIVTIRLAFQFIAGGRSSGSLGDSSVNMGVD
jgi:hypothetical protein